MKKLFLSIAALFAAVSLYAGEIVIDLNSYTSACSDGATINPSVANGVLTANYTTNAGWLAAGIEFALGSTQVDSISFEYIGDANIETWVSFLVYLKDTGGLMWYSNEADLSISSWNTEWAPKCYFPTDALWEENPDHEAGAQPFVALGFMANPGAALNGSFAIRNVKVYVPNAETALDNVANQTKVQKVIRNGQVLFIRDGKAFNVLGAELAK